MCFHGGLLEDDQIMGAYGWLATESWAPVGWGWSMEAWPEKICLSPQPLPSLSLCFQNALVRVPIPLLRLSAILSYLEATRLCTYTSANRESKQTSPLSCGCLVVCLSHKNSNQDSRRPWEATEALFSNGLIAISFRKEFMAPNWRRARLEDRSLGQWSLRGSGSNGGGENRTRRGRKRGHSWVSNLGRREDCGSCRWERDLKGVRRFKQDSEESVRYTKGKHSSARCGFRVQAFALPLR